MTFELVFLFSTIFSITGGVDEIGSLFFSGSVLKKDKPSKILGSKGNSLLIVLFLLITGVGGIVLANSSIVILPGGIETAFFRSSSVRP